MRVRSLAIVLGLLAACNGGSTDPVPDPGSTASPTPTPSPTEQALAFDDVETVVGGLEIPWEIAFVDDSTLLVTERAGRVRIVRDGSLEDQPAASIDVAHEGEGGLLGIALHPEFPSERFAYVYYSARGENRVSRFRVRRDLRLTDEETILSGIPTAQFHVGGRIAFGPDGMLYVATGDAREPGLAADRDSLAGKILRITPDGSVPDDNPFDGSPVYAYGFRNPQGLAWDGEGRLFASDHGPTGEFDLCCLDEINHVEQGRFYGWPYFSGGRRAQSGEPPDQHASPLASSGGDNTWAPSGIAVVHDALLVTNLVGRQLLRFPLRDGGPQVSSPSAVIENLGRLRAVRAGPDGCVYLTTSNRDGRGQPQNNDDRVSRVCPSEA